MKIQGRRLSFFIFQLLVLSEGLRLYTSQDEKNFKARYRRSESKSLRQGGRNVCSFKSGKIAYETKYTVATELYEKEVCCKNFGGCWKKCKRSGVRTIRVTRTVSKMINFQVFHCCQGWSVNEKGDECTKPVCYPHCQNNGVCVAPDKCSCTKGFQGNLCQIDVNECRLNKPCQQDCMNLPGTYQCLCRRGYEPNDVQSKTCQSVNECKLKPCRCETGSKDCGATCHDLDGSYECKCKGGYYLARPDVCTDRNECLEDPNICPHDCENTIGSYRCKCFPGYQLQGTKCVAKSLCANGNAGCEQECVPYTGGFVCACKDGYFLLSDSYQCQDVDECKGFNPCDDVTSTCVNTPGSYYCECKPGFSYAKTSFLCEDRNECAEKTALCEQSCDNTYGSYKCKCMQGYTLNSDEKTCSDINECSSNNKCEQICINTVGSYKCACKKGYTLDVDGEKCLPKPCPTIAKPFFGQISCEGESIGNSCYFSCNKGFKLSGPSKRICLPTRVWSGTSVQCIPKTCDVPIPPPYGSISLPCSLSYGSTCPVSCRKGFILRGNDMIKCDLINGVLKWDKSNVHCQEILVCKPNPCFNGGKCQIVTDVDYQCDCRDTGYSGRHCETLEVLISSIPKMDVNKKHTEVQLSSKSLLPVEISMFQEDPAVSISPQTLRLRSGRKEGKFTVNSTKTGIFWLTYQTKYEKQIAHVPDSLLFFYDHREMKAVTSLSVYRDCFQLQIVHSRCDQIEVSSTAYWESNNEDDFQTKGIAYIKANGFKFPLALGKMTPTLLDKVKLKRKPQSSSCNEQIIDEPQLQYVIKHDMFKKQFFASLNNVFPSWLQFSLTKELKYLSIDSLRVRVVSGSEVLQEKACTGPEIKKDNIYLLYKHREELAVNFKGKLLSTQTNGHYCFIISLCKREAHVVLPEDNRDKFKDLFKLENMMEYGFSTSFNSIGIIENPENICSSSYSKDYFILGGVSMDFKQPVISAKMKGDVYFGIEKTKEGEVIKVDSRCILGNGKFETPSLKITTGNTNPFTYEVNGIHPIKLISESTTQLILILSDASKFNMKSGVKPTLQKINKPLHLTLIYKEEKPSTGSSGGGDNMDKITSLSLLQIVVMDIDMVAQLLPDNGVFKSFKSLVFDWNIKIGDDINELYGRFDDSNFVNSKISRHYNKAISIGSHLKSVIDSLKAASPSDSNIASLKKSKQDLDGVLPDLKKYITNTKPKIKFSHPTISFTSDFCLFKPCLKNARVMLYPMRYDIGLGGFCMDMNKGPLEQWQVKVDNLAGDESNILSFKDSKTSYLCLSREGVTKARLNGNVELMGSKISGDFFLHNNLINIPRKGVKIYNKYDFLCNSTLDLRLKSWNLMSAKCHGSAGQSSLFVKHLQTELDKQCVANVQKINERVKKSEENKNSYDNDIKALQIKIDKANSEIQKSKDNLAKAKKLRDISKSEFQKHEKHFRENRAQMLHLEKLLTTSCKVKNCPFSCVKKPVCKVCREPYIVNKTIPLCKVTLEDRSYKYLKSVKRVCSHVVEERDFKYTGNCKEPAAERAYAESVIERLNKKQLANKTFTLEDAYLLESVNKKAGQEMRKQIEKQMFFETLQYKMMNNLLNEDDYAKLEELTNKTFATKVRRDTKNITDAIFMREISVKLNRSEALTDSDYAKLRLINPQFEKNLRKSQAVNEIAEKFQKTGSISDADLAKLKKIAPEYAKNFTERLNQEEIQRKMFDTIQAKISNSTLQPEDLKELERVNPDAAAKLKAALQEQLKQKVGEMKKQLDNVKGSLDAGLNNSDFKNLKSQLDKLGGKSEKYDKKTLEELQKKILANKASTGSLFDEVIERLDLDYDIMNITGNIEDLKDVMTQFFNVLPKFDIPLIFQRSPIGILVGLESVQEWFVSLVKIFKQVVEKCDDNYCKESTNFLVGKALKNLNTFRNRLCSSSWLKKVNINSLNNVCIKINNLEDGLKAISNLSGDKIAFISRQIVNPLSDLVKLWKEIREEVKKLNEIQWERNTKINLLIRKYESFMTSIDRAFKQGLKTIKMSNTFSSSKLIKTVKKSLNDINSTLSLVQIEVLNAMITNIVGALEKLPNHIKQNRLDKVTVDKLAIQPTISGFTFMTNELHSMLATLCEKKSPIELPSYKSISILIKNSLAQLNLLLTKGSSVEDINRYTRRFGNIAKQLVIEVNKVKDELLPCNLRVEKLDSSMNDTQNAIFEELKVFLRTPKIKLKKTIKDLTEDMRKTLGEFKNGITSPIGEYMDKMNEMIENSPSFNIPLIFSASTKTSKLMINSLNDNIKNIKTFFDGIKDVLLKCDDCKPEEIFGKENLKEIASKVDGYLDPLLKNAKIFTESTSLSPQGLPLILSSLQEMQTTLQTLSMSGTGFSKSGIENIIDAFDEGIESFNFVRDGLEETHYLLRSVKDKDIKVYKDTLSEISTSMKNLFKKSKGFLKSTKNIYEKIEVYTERLYEDRDSLKLSVLKKRYDIIKEGSDIIKDITWNIYEVFSLLGKSSNLYSSLDKSSLEKYVNEQYMPGVEENIDVLKQSVKNIMTVTNKMAKLSDVADKKQTDLKVLDIDMGEKIKEISANVGTRKLALARNLKDIGSSVGEKVKNFVKTSSEYIDRTIGSVKTYFNETYNRVKKKFEKYSKIVDDITATLDEIKDKPISKIGDIKDAADELIESLNDYDLALIMSSNPNVIPRKVEEMKALFTNLGSAMKEIDTILQKCKHCNANNIFGYNYIKSLASKINSFSLNMFSKMQNFSQKIGDSIGEVQDISETVKGINSRFAAIFDKGSFSADTFKDLSDALMTSSNDLSSLTRGTQNIAKILFDKDIDIQVLEGTIRDMTLQLATVMNKSHVVAKSAESVYNKALEVQSVFNDIKSSVSSLDGPIEKRIALTKDLAGKINGMVGKLPEILQLSQDTLEKAGIDGTWISSLAGKTENLASTISSLMNKTDQVMDAANIAVGGFNTIKKEIPQFKSKIKEFKDASWDNKIPALKNIVKDFSSISNIAIDSSIKTANALNISLTKNDLKSAAETVIGKERMAKYRRKFKDVSKMMNELQKGPITDIGKLTDSVENFVDGFDEYDFGKMFLENPANLNDKLLEFKELANTAGNILKDIGSIVANCKDPPCSSNSILGSGFVGNLVNKLDEKFHDVEKNVSNFINRTGTGLQGLSKVMSTVKSIRGNFRGISKEKNVTKKLSDISKALTNSSEELNGLVEGTNVIFESIFGKNKDMEKLQKSFEGLVTKVGSVLNKSAIVLPKAGKVYESVNKVSAIFKTISSNFDELDEGPVEQRLKILKEITGGITNMGSSLSTVFNETQDTLKSLGIDSAWMNDVSKGMYDVSKSLGNAMNKSNIIINGAEEITADVRNMQNIVSSLKNDYEQIKDAPWGQKFKIFNNSISKVDNLLTSTNGIADTINSVLQNVSGGSIYFKLSLSNVTGKLSGVLGSLSNSVTKVAAIHSNVTQIIESIKSGPVEKVGKLVDTTKSFVKSLKNYDLSEILVLGPKFVKGRISDLKDTVFESGQILKNISGLINLHCKVCNFDKILGNSFVKNITGQIKEGLGNMTTNIENIMDKVSENAGNIAGVVDSVKGIKNQLDRVKNLEFDQKSFETISEVLTNTADHLEVIQSNSSAVFKSIFSENKEMVDLLGKYEGFVNRMNGVLVKTSNFTKNISVTVGKFNELKNMFELGKESLENLTKGPIESRLEAVKGIVNVVNSVMTGLPDVLKSVPISSKWLDGFGKQLEGITGSVSKVMNTTLSITNDLSETVGSVRDIQETVSAIKGDVTKLSSGSFDQKIKAANNIVDKVQTLTGQINVVANNASNIIERVTGVTLIKTDIFGNTSANILQQISDGLGTVADRYEKFQNLSENIKEAFKNIKEDPIKFALEDLPKLFNQSEKFVKLIFNDVSGIAKKIGIDLGDVNLDKDLVASAKAFYGFAKDAMKTIQSGAAFVSDFKNLLNSKDFVQGLENLQNLAQSGSDFIQSIDKLGDALFDDWEEFKGYFDGAIDWVKGSLGLNLEKMGSFLSKGLDLGGDVLSIYSNIKSLLDLKEFNAETLVKAANSAINIAKAGVSLLNKLGMDIGGAGLESAQQAIGTIAAVVQLYEGIKGFTEWLNDVCDITYEDVITTRNLTYLCLKDEEFIETLKIPIEKCTPSYKQIERGYKEGKLCCDNSECVYMQSVECLREKEYCIQERIKNSKRITSVQAKMKAIYKNYYNFSEKLQANEKEVKIKEIVLQKEKTELEVLTTSRELSQQILSKAKKNILLIKKKLTLINSITTSSKSQLRITSVVFDATLVGKNQALLPIKIEWTWKSTKKQITLPFDFSSVQTSFASSADSIIREYINLEKLNSRKRRSISFSRSLRSQIQTTYFWVEKCGVFASIHNVFTAITKELQSTVNGVISYNKKVIKGTSVSDKTESLLSELNILKEASFGDLTQVVSSWIRSSELKISQGLPEECDGFLDCIESQAQRLKSLYQQNVPIHEEIKSQINTIERQLSEIVRRQFQNKVELLQILNQLISSFERINANTYFCDEVPKLVKKMPMVIHAYINEDFELECTIEGPAGMSYKWVKGDTVVPGANQWKISIKDVEKSDQGYYHCQGEIGDTIVTSNKVLLRVFNAPTFKSQPQSRSIEYPGGGTMSLVCNATSEPQSFYKWYFMAYGSNNVKILTESSILTIARVQRQHAGNYWCQISDGYRTVESRKISIDIAKSVKPKAVSRIYFDISLVEKLGFDCQLPQTAEQVTSLMASLKSLFPQKYDSQILIETEYEKQGENAGKIISTMSLKKENKPSKETTTNYAISISLERQSLKETIQGLFRDVFNGTQVVMQWRQCKTKIALPKNLIEWQANEKVCPSGYGLRSNNLKCVECAPGTFDIMNGYCSPCPIGSYQPYYKQNNCLPCNSGYLTKQSGASNKLQCEKMTGQKVHYCNQALNVMILVDGSSKMSSEDMQGIKEVLASLAKTTKPEVTKISLGTVTDTINVAFTSVSPGDIYQYFSSLPNKKSTQANIRMELALDFSLKFLKNEISAGEKPVVVSFIKSSLNQNQYFNIKEKIADLKGEGIDVYFVPIGQDYKSVQRFKTLVSKPISTHLINIERSTVKQWSSVIAKGLC